MKLLRFFIYFAIWIVSAGAMSAAEQWRKVTTPNVTIYTADSAPIAKDWAIAIEGFRASLQDWFKTGDQPLEPMILVVFEGDKAYAGFMGTKRGMDRDMNVNVSRFSFANGRFMAAMNSDYNEVLQRSIFTQSGVWLAGSFKRPMPLWLLSGLQEVYGDFSLNGNKMMIGGRVEQNVHTLRDGLFLPLDQLLGLTTDSKTYKDDRANRFNSEAWALVHYLLLGNKGANRPALIRFVNKLQQGATNEEALAAAFPEGIPALNEKLRRYVLAETYRTSALEKPLAELAKNVAVTKPPQAEVDVTLGLLALQMRGEAAATNYIQKAVAAAPNSPLTLEAEGEMGLVRGDRQSARDYYTRAVAAGSTFYFASFYPAMDRALMMFGGETATDNYDAAMAREVADLMKRTIRQRPTFYSAREMFAGLIGSLAEVNDDDRQMLADSLVFIPIKASFRRHRRLTKSRPSNGRRLNAGSMRYVLAISSCRTMWCPM